MQTRDQGTGPTAEYCPACQRPATDERREDPMEGRNYGIDEAAQFLGISRGELYRQLRQGAITSIHVGRRSLIPYEELTRFTAEKLREARQARELATAQ